MFGAQGARGPAGCCPRSEAQRRRGAVRAEAATGVSRGGGRQRSLEFILSVCYMRPVEALARCTPPTGAPKTHWALS